MVRSEIYCPRCGGRIVVTRALDDEVGKAEFEEQHFPTCPVAHPVRDETRTGAGAMTRTVTLRRHEDGSLELLDEAWPEELDVAQELLEQGDGLRFDGGLLSFDLRNARATYRRVGLSNDPRTVRFVLVEGHVERER